MRRLRWIACAALMVACSGTSDTGSRTGSGGAGGGEPIIPAGVDQLCRDFCANEDDGEDCGPQNCIRIAGRGDACRDVQACYERCLGAYEYRANPGAPCPEEYECLPEAPFCTDEWIADLTCLLDLECSDLFGDCDSVTEQILECERDYGSAGPAGPSFEGSFASGVPRSARDEAVRVEVYLVDSCDSVDIPERPNDEIGSTFRLRDGTQGPPIAAPDPGEYGLYAVALDANCAVVAAGCDMVTVVADSQAVLTVTMGAFSGEGCAAGEQCSVGTGACIGLDGGTGGAGGSGGEGANSSCSGTLQAGAGVGVVNVNW